MRSPLISVIVPCFNGSAYLRACVGSVMGQACDAEVIIVDDGSSDDSLAVARELSREHADRVLVVTQGNKGQAAAQNVGIRAADGKYLGFLDVDDEYAVGFLNRASEILENHGNFVAVQGQIQFVDLHRTVEAWQRESMEATMPGTILVRAQTVRQIGGFPIDPAFRGEVAGEDGCFRLQLPLFGEVALMEQPALRYRVRRGSHFDFFLDRAVMRDGKLTFVKSSAQEADGSFARAMNDYREQVALGMIEAQSEIIRREVVAGANLKAYQQAFAQAPGVIDAAAGFAMYTLVKQWPVAGTTVQAGGDARSTCWLAAGCKASGAGKVVVIEDRDGGAGGSAAGWTSGQIEETLRRLKLAEAVEMRNGDAVELAAAWQGPLRLLMVGNAPLARQKQIIEAWLPLLSRHTVLVVQGDYDRLEFTRLCVEIGSQSGRWKALVEIPGLIALQSELARARH